MTAGAGFAGYAGAMLDVALKVTVLVLLFGLVRPLVPARSVEARRAADILLIASLALIPFLALAFGGVGLNLLPDLRSLGLAGVAYERGPREAWFDPRAWTHWIVAIWLGGVILTWVRLAIGVARLSAIARGAAPLCAGPAPGLSPDGRGLRILVSSAVRVPVTWGWRRPVILLPRVARRWSAERLDVVLRHEAEHVLRHDWLVRLSLHVVTGLHWFHPAARWSLHRVIADLERACDDRVLLGGVDPARYAAHLVDIARDAGEDFATGGAVAAVRLSELEERVRAILDWRETRPRSAAPRVGLALLLLVLATSLIGAVNPWACRSGSCPLADSNDDARGGCPQAVATTVPSP